MEADPASLVTTTDIPPPPKEEISDIEDKARSERRNAASLDYVFVPQVERGWRPYVRGHWVWTDEYGWYWASNEPFAWATYHYGRWGYDPEIGWFWVPGNVWAPAWVTWRRGGGHVGWAPIAPRGRGYALGYAEYYEPPIVEAWVFVPERRFVAVDVVSYVEPVVEINTILRESRESFHLEHRGDVVVNEFLPRREVAKIVGTEIKEYKVRDAREPRQSVSGDTIEAFRPKLTDAEPKEAPAKVVERVDELKSKPKLSETAKGERPEGAPPSAAELKPSKGIEGTPESAKTEGEGKPEGKSAEERPGEPKGKSAEEQGKPERSKAEEQGKPEGKSADERGGEPKGKGAEEQGKPERSKAEQQGKPERKSAEKRPGEPKGKSAEEQGKPERSKAEQQGKPEGKSAEERGG
jgi:hypothetical protein